MDGLDGGAPGGDGEGADSAVTAFLAGDGDPTTPWTVAASAWT